MSNNKKTPLPQRGPESHERREQIIHVAIEHFSHYGYNKTSVGDIAKAIGVSNAYIYKFFSSKKDIAEVVCAETLAAFDKELEVITDTEHNAAHKIRLMFKMLMCKSLELMSKEKKLHEIAALSFENNWCSNNNHQATLFSLIEKVIVQGREDGIFDRKAPLDEVCLAIRDTMLLISHPLLLEQKQESELDESLIPITNMVLRSLAI
ncbi:TetR/AcrR family transcriptional regulator [uncultured Shewanella sp.]|uniref:TetR/AcrR family transcriptional regulator n=1 Tax=uncultured Shewanella sp. TaxID=173975 RepID=UPI0026326081|nr:TetR/AcrR family transcriptional regulator [uncultured Shewanella sp.]